jgi:integrase
MRFRRLDTHKRYVISGVALLRRFRDMPLDKIETSTLRISRPVVQANSLPGAGRRTSVCRPKKKLRPATVNRELACLKALVNFVIEKDVLSKNPVSKVKMLGENNQQNRVLSYTEQQSYLASASPVLGDIATLILNTGMRPDEVYTVQS